MSEVPARVSLGQLAALACVLEATAEKPGNVHRGADFADLSYFDFVASAAVLGPALDDSLARRLPLGSAIRACVAATRQAVASNTNLGLVLLITPLAWVPRTEALAEGVAQVLAGLDPQDVVEVYAAIRLAQPGGLGRVDEADVAGRPPDSLLAAMRLAADRDLVARQYANGFREVFELVVPAIARGVERDEPLAATVVRAFLELLAAEPDSLIARKCGPAIARQASLGAAQCLDAVADAAAYERALADFDFWLRADGHRRNPGTTADLIGAGLFAALREGIMRFPLRFYTPCGETPPRDRP